jgi:hypothetical protein
VAILMLVEAKGATEAQYRAANEQVGIRSDADAPDGLIAHVAGRTEDGVLVADVWESHEKLQQFVDGGLRDALADAGISVGEPTILPVHNMIESGKGSKAGVLVLIDVAGLGPADYDRMVSEMDAHVADGSDHPAVSHTVACKDDGLLVVDVWESPEAFDRFAQTQVAPAGESIGLGEIEPRFVPVIGRTRRLTR